MKTKINNIIVALFCLVAAFTFSGCDDDEDDKVVQETGTVTDVDGNTYKTVKIGNRWWMAEDLRSKHYRNGFNIRKSQVDSVNWSEDSIGAYCEVFDNQQNIIGQFYNFNSLTNSNQLAPEGWHIPTDDEWRELEQYLGMNAAQSEQNGWRGSSEGDKLKMPAPEGWTKYGSVWGNNESGFSAAAKGCRMFNGGWGDPGLFAAGFWWSSTQTSNDKAFYRYLDYKQSNIFRGEANLSYGFAVRCVRD